MFEADQGNGGARWPIVRIGCGSETEVVLLSSRFLPLTVHWVGRSVPCCATGCALCAWLPARGLFYLPVALRGRTSILELGSISACHLEQHAKLLHQGMRPGLEIRLVRRSAKAPIFSEVVGERPGVAEVTLIELACRVCALYQLPPANPAETFDEYQDRLRLITRRRSEVESERLKRAQVERVQHR